MVFGEVKPFICEQVFQQEVSFTSLRQKAIQKSSIAPYFKDDYVLLYGSFANGKADIQDSDIDLHPGPKFLQQYLNNRLTSKYNKPEKDPHSEYSTIIPTAESIEMSERLLKTEQILAQLTSRSSYDPSQFMTIVPSNGSFFKIQNLGYYNSLIVKVTHSQLSLYIVDTFGSGQIFEVIIN
jgi:hypothetical protein